MSIVRSARPHLNYSVIHNELIEDKRISFNARGLLIYLLSKPDHWRTSMAHLAKNLDHIRRMEEGDL